MGTLAIKMSRGKRLVGSMTKEHTREFLRSGVRGFNACISSRCTLECFACLRQSLKQSNKHPGFGGGDLSVSQLKKLLARFNCIDFNGQVSDPIFNPNLKELLETIYATPNMNYVQSRIHTAATSKKYDLNYYKQLFDANPKLLWIFGIDGLPEQSHMYRKNQDGQFLFDVMCMAAEMGVPTVWQWIVFNYNEASIPDGLSLAKAHGLSPEFVFSTRFNGYEEMKPTITEKQIWEKYLSHYA